MSLQVIERRYDSVIAGKASMIRPDSQARPVQSPWIPGTRKQYIAP
jgi:hypothetical protein